MILNNLSVHNFRGFEDLEINFDKKLTVIVGNNGVGKTTILEAAAIAVGTMFTAFNSVSSMKIDKDDAHIKSFVIGSQDDVQIQYPVSVSASGIINQSEVKWQRSLNGPRGSTTVKDARELIDIAETYQKKLQSGDSSLILPIIAYYGTGRLWDSHREKKVDTFSNSTRINGYIDSLDGQSNIKLMMNWFQKMTIQKYQRQEEKLAPNPMLDVVFGAVEKCFESVTGYRDVSIQYNFDTNGMDVYYTDSTSARMRIPMASLSDGYKGTISLIADIAYRMAVLNPQLQGSVIEKTPGVVLIDEIDLHLHPAWQQRILNDLTTIFPEVQFIVTTHAPAVINSIQSANLVILENGETREPDGQTFGKDANTILQGVMAAYERPLAVKKMFRVFYRAIDANDFENATNILTSLEEAIGNDDSELASCRVKLKLARIRGGSNA